MKYFAKKRTRALEAVIDYTIYFAGFFICLFAFGEYNTDGELSLKGMYALTVIGLWFAYFPLSEGTTGQTLGKKILGIRVVKLSGEEINFWDSLLRRLFDNVDLLFLGLVGILVMRNSDKTQRVGDLIAKTIVIEDNFLSCENCGEQVILNSHEFLNGQFICPKCGHECIVHK